MYPGTTPHVILPVHAGRAVVEQSTKDNILQPSSETAVSFVHHPSGGRGDLQTFG